LGRGRQRQARGRRLDARFHRHRRKEIRAGDVSRHRAGSFPRRSGRRGRRPPSDRRIVQGDDAASETRRTLHAARSGRGAKKGGSLAGGRERQAHSAGRADERRSDAMIIELGHFALILALAVALLQAGLTLTGAARNDLNLMAAGRLAAMAQFALIALAFATLVHAYFVSDFSVANVAENSSSAKPLLYKLTSVWGNHEGSMVLWVLILALYGAAIAWFGDAM